jgi:D-aspartate ligase
MFGDGTPAVVVGGELSGLGVARSLWRENVKVYVVAARRGPANYSRSCRTILAGSLDGRPLVDALLGLARRIGDGAVLLLTDEMAVDAVSRYREELTRAYRFFLPSPDTVALLAEKQFFQDFAERNGFAVPRSVVVEKHEDLDRLGALQLPLIVKPTAKAVIHSGQAERIGKFETLDDAIAFCARMLPIAAKLIAQEWIPGPDSNIYFCLFYRGRDGKILSIFTGKKILSDPPELGTTVICRAAPEAQHVLEPVTNAFADRIDFKGMGSIEFKRDAHGRFVMIEPTVGRADWQEEIATLCGVNVPFAAYRDELGLAPVPIGRVRHDIAWRASFLKPWPKRESRPRTRVYDGFWRWGDPLPAVQHYMIDALSRHALRPLLERAGFG